MAQCSSAAVAAEEVGHDIRHEAIIDFCHVTSEQLLKVIEYLVQYERSKSKHSSGFPLSKTPEVESQRHTMAFLWLGKH